MIHNHMKGKPGAQPPNHTLYLLRAIQFDHWILTGSTPRISLMSHDDEDHNPQKCVSFPTPIVASQKFAGRLTGDIVSVPPDTFWPVGDLLFYSFESARINLHGENPQCTKFHSDWWYLTSAKYPLGVLFVGELDYPEVPVLKQLVEYVEKSGRPFNALLLPSYGGVTTHRVPPEAGAKGLSAAIEDAVRRAKRNGLLVGGLPHPLRPAWTDLEFLRLPQRSRIL